MSEPFIPYAAIGGAEAVRRLVDRFYDRMDHTGGDGADDVRAVRALHPADLGASREKLYEFLSGWLGGPPLFVEKYGHPRLRMRHMRFPIASRERDQWMLCMREALAEVVVDVELRDALERAFADLADHMRNRPG